ncbi:hypothetical protein R5R35_008453 [Gryllus longicercus]|uniref:Lipid droplet-associated hydrolase n=1 Tax=Gryllus longicercus TaxID=2509291 RepID=A0AAN9VRM2_9ORTH
MKKSIVEVNGVATYVATWGAWIEDDLSNHRDLIVCIPGNPGVTGYYEEFLETLYCSLNIPVWIVSHAGHEVGRDVTIPPLRGNRQLYSLEGQITHKIQFLNKYVPPHVNIYFVGHSIGTYMILQVLKQCPEINARVKKSYMLFPAIHHLKDTPNGKLWGNFLLRIKSFLLFLAWIFIYLPIFIRKILIYIYFLIFPAKKEMIRPTVKLLNPRALQNVFFIAQDNLDNVKELDHELIDELSDKLLFYFSITDGWAPLSLYEYLKKLHPQVRALTSSYKHAFVLEAGRDVAGRVSKWIESEAVNIKCRSLSR